MVLWGAPRKFSNFLIYLLFSSIGDQPPLTKNTAPCQGEAVGGGEGGVTGHRGATAYVGSVGSSATAYVGSSATAYVGSSATAYAGSRATAYAGSSATAYIGSSATAYVGSSATAYIGLPPYVSRFYVFMFFSRV